jgi:glycosyltransferase involved in cell wall biosynthesis
VPPAFPLIALDATYSAGLNLSGVGVYCRELRDSLAAAHPEVRFLHCYRPQRFLAGLRGPRFPNARVALLLPPWIAPRQAGLFHGLNQRLPGTRFRRAVCTFHDLFVLTGEYSTPEFRARFAAQARDAAARCDIAICVSAHTAAQVRGLLGVEAGRLAVVHHGVRGPEPGAAEGPRERVVLHVGAIQKRKNITRLVAAFERALDSSWRLVLAGSAGFGAGPILQRIESSPARNRIEVTGYLPDAELRDWFRRAWMLAFPSLDEGFGIPALEAMAYGTPVVASNRSALPEVCGEAALLVDPEDEDALAQALERVAAEPALRRELADKGRLRAAQFTWPRAAAQTWDVYRKLLD